MASPQGEFDGTHPDEAQLCRDGNRQIHGMGRRLHGLPQEVGDIGGGEIDVLRFTGCDRE
jgi:hypothetical protein